MKAKIVFFLFLAALGASAAPFVEPFNWSGQHAAVLNPSSTTPGNTVWWNANLWDVRGDTGYLAAGYPLDITNRPTTGYHTDIHKAASSVLADGTANNAVYIIGGDGSPGVANMRVDNEGMNSARLRNPVVISPVAPTVVDFWSNAYVTTGHWFELALTPTNQPVLAGEFTAVPSSSDPLAGPYAGFSNVGPGYGTPHNDAINVVVIGSNDVPCTSGFYSRVGIKRAVGGAVTDYTPIVPDPSYLQPVPGGQDTTLAHYKVSFSPNSIDVQADFGSGFVPMTGSPFAVNIPWAEAYLHLIGALYQADHHPQGTCVTVSPIREILWRNLSVSSVKYARTTAAPLGREGTGTWINYDLRDIQRFGPAINGLAQANPVKFDLYTSIAHQSINRPIFGGPPGEVSFDVGVTLAADQASAARAQFLYDCKGLGGATVSINGRPAITLPWARTVPVADTAVNPDYLQSWVRRSVDIPAGQLVAGANTLRVFLQDPALMDRMQLEFDHAQ